jgi:BASS family bile acid:Na+ symporter
MWWRNRNVLLTLSLVLALPAGQAAPFLEPLVLPAFGLVMTLALVEVSGKELRSVRAMVLPALAGLALNFVLNGSVVLSLSTLFSSRQEFYTGWVLMAAVPPTVAVVPFTFLLNGDRAFALFATIGCYLGALAITPLMAVWLLGAGFIDPFKIFKILLLLILLPLLLSRLLLWARLAPRLEPVREDLINWFLALLVYIIVGVNRDLFLGHPLTLLSPIVISLISTFGLGGAISRIARLAGLRHNLTISLIFLGTMKDAGLAGALALTLFNQKAAVPASVVTVFHIAYFIWLSFWHERDRTKLEVLKEA